MASGYADVAGAFDGSAQLTSTKANDLATNGVDKYILMVVQAIDFLLMLVPILRHLVQEALAQIFVCGHKLMLPMLIMQSVLKVVIFGSQFQIQA